MRKLIWTCSQGGHYGGYADRLKGIVTAYLLAKQCDREFFIEWDGLTNLQECFEVPCVWDGPRQSSWMHFRTIDNLVTEEHVRALVSVLSDIKTEAVYISMNQYDQPHWKLLTVCDTHHSMAATFSAVLNLLLTPKPAITDHPAYLAAAEFLETQKPVGVQVRTGEYPYEDGVECADTRDVLKRVMQDRAPGVFIASDSPFWKDHLSLIAEIPSYQIPFTPAHIERSAPDYIRDTFLLTVIEHQILSKCSKVYTGWGGFGRTAAWWGGKPCINLLLPPAQSDGRGDAVGGPRL